MWAKSHVAIELIPPSKGPNRPQLTRPLQIGCVLASVFMDGQFVDALSKPSTQGSDGAYLGFNYVCLFGLIEILMGSRLIYLSRLLLKLNIVNAGLLSNCFVNT